MPKEEAKLISLTIYCPITKETVDVTKDDTYFSSSSAPCDTCGSHGGIEVAIDCPACNKNHDIHLSEW